MVSSNYYFQCYLGGPIWLDPIHDLEFVKELLKSLDEKHHLKTVERMKGMFQSSGSLIYIQGVMNF